MESNEQEASNHAMLSMLEARLHRLEFLLHGSTDPFGAPNPAPAPTTRDDTVSARLANLESNLHRLASRHGVVQDVLDMHAHYPDLFIAAADDCLPTTLDPSETTAIILAHASSFSETLSRLTSIKDLPIPPASVSAKLVALQPRLDKVRAVQEAQMREVSELRARSAKLLERWIEVGVVGQGEVWAEWDERARAAERGVRRIEVAREKQEA